MHLTHLAQQHENSCAAHCMEIAAVGVSGGTPRGQSIVEGAGLWGKIIFTRDVTLGPDYQDLVDAKNSDPRKLLNYAKTVAGFKDAEMLSDDRQRDIALAKLPKGMRMGASLLYTLLTAAAKKGRIEIQSDKFYNCSYAMFKGPWPTSKGFMGYHNMLVVLDGLELKFYNPNEKTPEWKKVPKSLWTELLNQNQGAHSYVFTGIAVCIP